RRPSPPLPGWTLRHYSTQSLAYARPSTVDRYKVTSRIYPMDDWTERINNCLDDIGRTARSMSRWKEIKPERRFMLRPMIPVSLCRSGTFIETPMRSNETIPNEIPYITNPKSYIRAYATQTPAYTVMDVPGDAYQGVNNNYHNTGRHVPYSNINKSYQFVKDLRDQSLTKTQRIANQFQQSQLRDLPAPQSMGSIYEQKERLGRDQIDLLIRDMEWKLRTGAEGDFILNN
uniref:Lebocin-4 n=1 Tax=Loa loa TaxID=7209 RepID=A0A1I7VH87_LOALO